MKYATALIALCLTGTAMAQGAPNRPIKSTGNPDIDALYAEQLARPLPPPQTSGQPVTVLPSPPVNQVYPPPRPKDEYPVCAVGRIENCVNPGDIRRGEAQRPTYPGQMTKPAKPPSSGKPAKPGHSNKPTHPQHPEHPEHPTHPDHPDKPDKPQKPEKPKVPVEPY